MVFSEVAVNITLESDPLVMHDHAETSSTGCVLRGILNIHLKQPAKIKSITLVFSGTLHANWQQLNIFGHIDRKQHDQSLINHRWELLPPHYMKSPPVLEAGDHAYDFELPLTGDLPATIKVDNVYIVQYQLKATIHRPYFLPSYECQRNVYITRRLDYSAVPDRPLSVRDQWRNKLSYHISIPSNVFHYGSAIPVTIHFIPLVGGLSLSHVDSTLKEYSSCGPMDGLFQGQSRSYSETVYYRRTKRLVKRKPRSYHNDNDDLSPWRFKLTIPICKALCDLQADIESSGVRVHHELKFVFYIETEPGHRPHPVHAALPILIQPKSNTDRLPTYNQRDNGKSYPYHPSLMVKLLQANQ